MSAPQPLAEGRRDIPLHGSLPVRVLLLIDVGDLVAELGANGVPDTTWYIDGLRLSVLRVLSQLCMSCPKGSRVEWATRFFDSRHGGVGKTPAELKARLRSRQALQGTRGFKRVTQDSFEAFGNACLAVACGLQGDPLARDREAALRRWSHARKKKHSNWDGQTAGTEAAERWTARAAPKAGLEGSRNDDTRRMYDGHDMSRHEVVVRSLLEVLQEFGEAGEGDRAVGPSVPAYSHDIAQLQLLLLHSTCPHTDEEVERFAVRGNFTNEAKSFAVKPPEEKASTLADLLNAGLGKAVLRARSRGVSFLWQEGVPTDERGVCSTQPATIVHRLLSGAGGSGILSWGRVVGSTGLLPPSVALREWLVQRGGCWGGLDVGRADLGGSLRTDGYPVCIALNGQGVVDAHLVALPLSSSPSCSERPASSAGVGMAPRGTCQAVSRGTPWRLMGTLPVSEVWPRSLEGQGWGPTVVLRAENDLGAPRWRDLLRELRERDMVASVSLPLSLFARDGAPEGDDMGEQGVVSDAATVALLMPVNGDCAVGWSVRGLENTRPGRRETSRAEHVGAPMQQSGPRAMGCGPSAGEGENAGVVAKPMPGVGSVGNGPTRAQMSLKMRQAEVGLAMQNATLAKRRRRRAKAVPGEKARGTKSLNSSIAGAAYRATGSGGRSESLSPRDSASLCFTGEGTSADGAGFNIRQWRLEMASETSHGSGSSPRGLRLFDAAARTAEDDERTSSTGSSSGPRRALHQALEDASSRSSLLGPDADFSSTPGSKEGAGWSGGGTAVHAPHDDAVVGRGSGAQRGILFSTSDDASAPPDLAGVEKVGASELPMSFLSEPRLACLPGAPLPAEFITYAERCARNNQAAAAATIASGASRQAEVIMARLQSSGSHGGGARNKFIDAVRSLESRRQAAGRSLFAIHLSSARAIPECESGRKRETAGDDAAMEVPTGGGLSAHGEEPFCSALGDGGGGSDEALGFDDRVSKAVAGLLKQYREVVEGGHRSPIDFVVRTVPEAIRDLTDNGASFSTGDSVGAEDRNTRAAQVLAAVVSGLTSTPEELSAKHRANRGLRPVQAGASNTAKPAMQKIRDYQLQALLLCQLHMLAMDLPETPQSLTAFTALATSGTGKANGEPRSSKGKKSKGKGKGKKRRRRDSDAREEQAPVRPSDPLPDYRRTRLVDYLQPISTMLDACTVTGAPPADDGGGGVNGGGGAANGFNSRAYDGTLSDFMELSLVAHFASRLPRTLSALFDDFERHPPDTLVAALDDTQGSEHQGPSREAGGVGEAAGAGCCREADTVIDSASYAVKGPAREGDVAATDGATSKSMSTAGILLSDRTAIAHNHFKMSGVLNGFREVKLKNCLSLDGLHPRVLGGVSGNGQSGHDASRGKGEGEHGAWRTRGGGGGGRDSRSRVTRDSKQAAVPSQSRPEAASTTAPTTGTRHSPRLVRNRPDKGINEVNGVSTTHKSVLGSKRASVSAETAAAPQPRKRRQGAASSNPPKIGAGRGTSSGRRTGVLVVETPQKMRGNAVSRTRLRGGGPNRAPQNDHTVGNASPATGAPATAGSTLLLDGGHIPGSPSASVHSPSRGAAETRRGATKPSDPEPGATARMRVMPSPPSWRVASSSNRLFVAESPGDAMGARTARSMWAGGDLGGDGDGVSRQLMTESAGASASASPLPREHVVVPNTPA